MTKDEHKTETETAHPQFERRSVELARMFGQNVECFEELTDCNREFFEIIGYTKVCQMLVLADLNKGMSIRRVAIRYELTAKQVQRIKENGRGGRK